MAPNIFLFTPRIKFCFHLNLFIVHFLPSSSSDLLPTCVISILIYIAHLSYSTAHSSSSVPHLTWSILHSRLFNHVRILQTVPNPGQMPLSSNHRQVIKTLKVHDQTITYPSLLTFDKYTSLNAIKSNLPLNFPKILVQCNTSLFYFFS